MAKYKIVTDKSNTFFTSRRAKIASAVPTTGSFVIGDIIINSNISNNHYGWVCVTAGSPGTWETIIGLGDINAYLTSLNNLKTDNKSNLVASINEIVDGVNTLTVALSNTVGEPFISNDTLPSINARVSTLYTELRSALEDNGVDFGGDASFQRLIDTIGNATISNIPEKYQSNVWYRASTRMNVAKYGMCAEFYNDVIYILGGYTGSYLNTIDSYNVKTGVYTGTIANLPANRSNAVSAIDGDNIYIIGGKSSSTTLNTTNYCYNITSNTYSTKTATSTRVSDTRGSVINGKIYYSGGRSGSYNYGVVNTRIYDIALNSWSAGTSASQTFHSPMVASSGTDIYYVGGCRTVSTTHLTLNRKYSTETNTWTACAELPSTVGRGGAGFMKGRLYIVGGTTIPTTYTKTTYIYDPETDTWTTGADIIEQKREFGYCTDGDRKLYCLGGYKTTYRDSIIYYIGL